MFCLLHIVVIWLTKASAVYNAEAWHDASAHKFKLVDQNIFTEKKVNCSVIFLSSDRIASKWQVCGLLKMPQIVLRCNYKLKRTNFNARNVKSMLQRISEE